MERDLLGLRLSRVVDDLEGGPPDGGRQDGERVDDGQQALLLDLLPVGVEVDVLGVSLGRKLDGDTQLLAQVNVDLENANQVVGRRYILPIYKFPRASCSVTYQ